MSLSTHRVTVLLPVYNGAPFLREALDSIFAQTFRDFELLVIDDGSTDGSDRIAESYNDPRLRLVRNGANLGLVTTLNKGLRMAQGEYVARMDADDISLPHRLATQVRFLDRNPTVGVCGSWVRFIPREFNYVWKLPATSEEIRCRQFHGVGVAHPSVMLRKCLFLHHGLFYDPAYAYIEDYELWGRAMQVTQFANIREVLLHYRVSHGQVCGRHRADQLAAVAPLRLQRLQALGIDPTPAEHELHEAIMNDRLPLQAEFLNGAEQWLLRLDCANRRYGGYKAGLFSQHLLEIWIGICSSFAVAGLCTWNRCRGSKLFEIARVASWQQLLLYAGWLKHLWGMKGRSAG